MCEYRLVYSSPCGTDRLRKTGYVYGRIHVIVVVGLTAEAVAWVAGRPSTHCPGHEGFGGSA